MAYKILLAAMAAVVAASVADAVGSYDGQAYDATPTAYDDLLLQDLYKRLSMMTDNEDGTYSNAAGADGLWSGNQQENGDGATLTNGAFPTPGSEDEALKERLRDHEYLEHSSLFSEDGYNYLPGSCTWSSSVSGLVMLLYDVHVRMEPGVILLHAIYLEENTLRRPTV